MSLFGVSYGMWEWLALISFVPMALKQVIKYVVVVVVVGVVVAVVVVVVVVAAVVVNMVVFNINCMSRSTLW